MKEKNRKEKAQYIILACVKLQFSYDSVCKSCTVFGRAFVLLTATWRLFGVATPVSVFTTELSPVTRTKELGYLSFNKLLKPAFQHQFSCGLEGQH